MPMHGDTDSRGGRLAAAFIRSRRSAAGGRDDVPGPGRLPRAGRSAAVPGGFLRRIPAALLLLAAALALLLFGDGGVVQAQTVQQLVTNLDNDDSITATFDDYDLAQKFTTGPVVYTLRYISLSLSLAPTGPDPTVKIFLGSANGTEVATLRCPFGISSIRGERGAYQCSVPAGTTLDGDTSYWVVAEGGSGTWYASEGGYSADAPGFSIADYRESRGKDTNGSFEKTIGSALQIQVRGTLTPPGVTVSKTAVTVSEDGATDSYTIRLNSKPTPNDRVLGSTGNVTIEVGILAKRGNVTVYPTSLTFMPDEWDTAQTVTVTAVDDDVDDDNATTILRHRIRSDDAGYNTLHIADVIATATDNDTRGITITPTTVTVTEAAGSLNSARYRVGLTSQPTSDVTVQLGGGGFEGANFDFHVAPNRLRFNLTNWNTATFVTVTAADDAMDEVKVEMRTITHTVRGGDYGSNNVTAEDVTVQIIDDDNPPARLITTVSRTYTAFNRPENTATSRIINVYLATGVGEGSALTWSLEGADRADFTITKNAQGVGQLRFANVPNYEMPADAGADNVYDVTVKVTDSDGSTDALMVRVTVDDVNEAPTITGPNRQSVPENSTAVATFSATDVDASDTLTWSVESTEDGGKFTIDPSSGALRFTSAPDFETPTDIGDTAMNNTYVVTVKVSDARGLSDTHPILVTVTTINEGPEITTVSRTYTAFNRPENTATSRIIKTYRATGVGEGSALTWSLEGTDRADFTITKNAQGHGHLRFANAPQLRNAGRRRRRQRLRRDGESHR